MIRSPMTRWLRRCALCAAVTLALSARISAHGSPAAFQLRDFIGREWRNECVEFPLSKAQLKAAQMDQNLVGPDGKAALYQLVADPARKGAQRIAFLADLDPFETRAYQFTNLTEKAPTDLRIEETADLIRLLNDQIGVAIRKTPAAGEGPIEAIRLASGKWVGGSQLTTNQALTSYTAEITARGPVFSEVVCRAIFAGTNQWTLTFRVQAREPVALVDERFDLRDDSRYVFDLSRNFSPTHVFYRYSKYMPDGTTGKIATWKIAPSNGAAVFVLEPWLHWWERDRQGLWFGLYNETDPGLLAIGAREASAWVDPAHVAEHTPQMKIALQPEGDKLTMAFPLRQGARKWMIATPDKAASLAPLQDTNNLYIAPLPQQYLIKHSDFPLDRVKDYVFQWKNSDRAPHPRLFVRKADLAKLRQTTKPDPAQVARLLKTPLAQANMEDYLLYYLGTGDPELGKFLAEKAVGWVQYCVNMYVKQDWHIAPGFAPHHQTQLLIAINLADAILGGPDSREGRGLNAEQRERLRAQVAFLGYVTERADFWSPERGFAANPNMTTTMRAYQAAVGCFLPTHPRAAAWRKNGLAEMKDELYGWSDANGGWLEAPAYALCSLDYIIGCFLMAHNGGFSKELYSPRIKKVAEWLAKISTPPDARLNALRHLPPIGNTYLNQPTGIFGLLAGLWQNKDPKFAAEMQWMYAQQGSFYNLAVGGFHPTMAGYRKLLLAPDLPAQAPVYGSELFPETGLVLRNAYPSDRETMLHMIVGSHYQHYDYDSGSITLWGKGRIVADDFGYYARAPINDHSMVETPSSGGLDMRVKEFAPSQRFDYVRGVLGDWTRQIAFVKDSDPLAPNYFVLCDTLSKAALATWRLWLTCAQVTLAPQRAHVQGKEDVDLDVFFALPGDVELKTEDKTRTSACGMWWDPARKLFLQSAFSTTQTGLIITNKGARVFTALLYPRLKTEPPPVVTPLAEGKAFKIKTAAGTDYVFLSAEPFSFREGDIAFEGTSGAIVTRGDERRVSLGAAGTVSANGETLAAQKPAARVWKRIPP